MRSVKTGAHSLKKELSMVILREISVDICLRYAAQILTAQAEVASWSGLLSATAATAHCWKSCVM